MATFEEILRGSEEFRRSGLGLDYSTAAEMQPTVLPMAPTAPGSSAFTRADTGREPRGLGFRYSEMMKNPLVGLGLTLQNVAAGYEGKPSVFLPYMEGMAREEAEAKEEKRHQELLGIQRQQAQTNWIDKVTEGLVRIQAMDIPDAAKKPLYKRLMESGNTIFPGQQKGDPPALDEELIEAISSGESRYWNLIKAKTAGWENFTTQDLAEAVRRERLKPGSSDSLLKEKAIAEINQRAQVVQGEAKRRGQEMSFSEAVRIAGRDKSLIGHLKDHPDYQKEAEPSVEQKEKAIARINSAAIAEAVRSKRLNPATGKPWTIEEGGTAIAAEGEDPKRYLESELKAAQEEVTRPGEVKTEEQKAAARKRGERAAMAPEQVQAEAVDLQKKKDQAWLEAKKVDLLKGMPPEQQKKVLTQEQRTPLQDRALKTLAEIARKQVPSDPDMATLSDEQLENLLKGEHPLILLQEAGQRMQTTGKPGVPTPQQEAAARNMILRLGSVGAVEKHLTEKAVKDPERAAILDLARKIYGAKSSK